jgi:transposase
MAPLVLTADERDELQRLARRSRTNRSVAFRAMLILSCAEGHSSKLVAQRHRTSMQTVCKWRKRFLASRVEGLYDEPRVGGPRSITDEDVENIVVKTLETKPKGKTHWSTREMAAKAGISHTSVGKIWRAFGLKPHVSRTFKLSDDPQFVDKVRDIVGLYMNPPDHAVVFSFDEKSQIQALERAQPMLPMDLGQPERRTHNYVRHGTLDLFAALNVATGEVIARCKKRHRAKDLVAFFRELDATVDSDLEVHVVLDNLSAHKAPEVHRWLLRNPRFNLHFTPTYSSWLNLVERFFGLLTEQALKRGSHTSIPELRDAIVDYVEAHNERSKPFTWTKTADQILTSVRRFAQRTLQVHG